MGTPRPIARFALLFVIALWPALVSGGALWFPDLAPYVRGGHVAVETVTGLMTAPDAPPVQAAGPAGGLAETSGAEVSGVRSVAYSVLAYLAGVASPRFLALAAVQASAMAFLVTGFAGRSPGSFWFYAGALALGSGPVFASTAGPDVWAGLLLLGVLALMLHGAAMGRAERIGVAGIVAFAVAAHASHVLLGVALAVAAFAWRRLVRRGQAKAARRGRGGWLIGGAVAAGLVGVVGTSVIGFGEASLAPKRYPIVLARAIEDGPALWHLEAHCDEHAYAVCEVFPGDIPSDVGAFLWNEGGVRDLASPEQMERIRAEEPVILRRAAMEYPFFQLRRAVANFAKQAVLVAQGPALGRIAAYEGDGIAVPVGKATRSVMRPLAWLQGATWTAALAAVVGVLALWRLRADGARAELLALTAAGLLANAAVCGALSVPEARYQARIAWVFPLVAIAVVAGARRSVPRAPR